MSQPHKKSWLAALSPVQRTILGIFVIALMVFLGVIYGPHYDTSNTVTGDSLPPTVTVTGPVGTLAVNRSLVYQGVTITVTSVTQARSFSDDGKSQYAHTPYVLRVSLHVQAPSNQRGPVGLNYPDLTRLVLNDGTQLRPNLAQISPDILPGQDESGYLDFWVKKPLNLAELAFTLNGETIAFAG